VLPYTKKARERLFHYRQTEPVLSWVEMLTETPPSMIDTHQHLIYPDFFTYSWASGLPQLQGNFRLEEYRIASNGCEIEGTIFMEVDVDAHQSADEARFFCDLAADSANNILGVIASARPEEESFERHLDSIAHRKLAGIRRVLHTQPDELSLSPIFRENLRLLGRRGLPFDLCVSQRQLGAALELIRACPDTVFVLDHCGVPDIAGNDAPLGDGFRAWKEGIIRIAREENARCKISGISVYAREDQRTAGGLRPYIETVIEAFTPARCVWGGDWPVVNLGSGLAKWCELTRELLSPLTADEQTSIFSGNARGIYTLDS
jgi:predicted TIM-barrel fold metal-dependent hydrolase